MRIGFLGVGNMGQPMAGHLIDAGHELWLHDISEDAMRPLLERQARRTDSPRALADACESVVVSLPTLAAFRAVMDGPDGLLAGGAIKTLVNTCTVGGPFVEELVAACAAKGVTVVDAPISGGPTGARAGTLAVMVSGDPATVEAHRPVFDAWGPKVVVAGPKPGAAQIMKLTNNIIFAVGFLTTCEAMTMATTGGIDPEAMLEVLNNGTGRTFASVKMFPDNIVPGSFDFGATIDLLVKDVDLAIEQGEALGVPMSICQMARLALKHASFSGRGKQDLSRYVQIIEEGTRKG